MKASLAWPAVLSLTVFALAGASVRGNDAPPTPGDEPLPRPPAPACLPTSPREITASLCANYYVCNGTWSSSMSADGTRVAYVADNDPIGLNPDLNKEVFLYERPTQTLWQITESTGVDNVWIWCSLSGDGMRVAYTHHGDLTGGNPDLSRELFLQDAPPLGGAMSWSANRVQLTSGPNVSPHESIHGARYPMLNEDGSRLAFSATHDLTGENPDGDFEVFLYDDSSSSFRQITDSFEEFTPWYLPVPHINADGTRLLFKTAADPLGCAGGPNGLYLFDSTTESFDFIAAGVFDSHYSMDSSGRLVVFSTIWSLYLWDAATSPGACSPSLRKLEDSSHNLKWPTLSGDGTRLFFVTTEDLTGENPQGMQQVFTTELSDYFNPIVTVPAVTQIAPWTAHNAGWPSVDAVGSRVAYYHAGDGPDGYEYGFTYAECPREGRRLRKPYYELDEWPRRPFLDPGPLKERVRLDPKALRRVDALRG